MHALVLTSFGEPLVATELPTPEPGPTEVLVRIAASGVNPLDTKIRTGAAPHARVAPPAVLGIDLAGTVERIGADVTTFRPGDEVFGMTGGVGGLQGSLAEYAAVDARLLARKPTTLTMREAAALPLVAITAWEGLVDRAGVRAGHTVLVHGGAGGIGHVAIQLALARGARVIATGSPASLDTIKDLGAEPVDRTTTSAEECVARHTAGDGFDIVFDTVGGAVLDDSFRAVRTWTGHVVSALGWGTHALSPLSFRGATYSGVFTLLPLLTGRGRQHHGEILGAVATLVDSGALRPIVDPHRYNRHTADSAHRAVADGTARGKVVVSIDG